MQNSIVRVVYMYKFFFGPSQIGGPWPPHKPKVGPANSPYEGHFLKERKNFLGLANNPCEGHFLKRLDQVRTLYENQWQPLKCI